MKLLCLWTVLWNLLPLSPTSTAQNITIQVTSKYDLAINCSIINSNQLDVLQLIQLQRYNSTNGTFDKVISMSIYEKNSKILWLDKALENRSSANGTLKEAELRLFIGKESVQCSTDFTKYKCSMEGILKSGSSVTNEVTASPNDTCTSTSKPQITTTKKPENTPLPGNIVTSTPQTRTTRTSGNVGNADKPKRSSGTTLHISIKGVKTSQYTVLLYTLFWIPVWIIVKFNTDSA